MKRYLVRMGTGGRGASRVRSLCASGCSSRTRRSRDTPARLKQVFGERKLDPATWTLARTDAPGVRKLAAVLNIQYRALANRDINNSNALVLLDAESRIFARTDNIGEIESDFVAAIQKALAPR